MCKIKIIIVSCNIKKLLLLHAAYKLLLLLHVTYPLLQAMQKIPKPPILTLDPNDENIILDIPEDCNPKTTEQEPATKKEKVRWGLEDWDEDSN